MSNTPLHRKITYVGIKSVIFAGRPPLELTCLTRSTIRDAKDVLQLYLAKNACREHMQMMEQIEM